MRGRTRGNQPRDWAERPGWLVRITLRPNTGGITVNPEAPPPSNVDATLPLTEEQYTKLKAAAKEAGIDLADRYGRRRLVFEMREPVNWIEDSHCHARSRGLRRIVQLVHGALGEMRLEWIDGYEKAPRWLTRKNWAAPVEPEHMVDQ